MTVEIELEEETIQPKTEPDQFAVRRARRQKNPAHRYVALMALPPQKNTSADNDIEYYYERYSCKPSCDPNNKTGSFPFFILLSTAVQIGIFIYYYKDTESFEELCKFDYGMIKSDLIFHPRKRQEFWRFISYQYLHAGFHHIFGNMLFQLVFGIPLEMVHGSLRVGAVYTAGVIMGSIFSSIVSTNTWLLGASGGDYCLIFAQLANCIMNWDDMTWQGWVIRLAPVLAYASYDISTTLARINAGQSSMVSWSAHMGGAIAGLTFGIFMLKNFRRQPWEGCLSKLAFTVFITLLFGGVMWIIFWPGYSADEALDDWEEFNKYRGDQ